MVRAFTFVVACFLCLTFWARCHMPNALWSLERLLTEGEYCITFFLIVIGWGLGSSLTCVLVLCGLTGRERWVAESSLDDEEGADVVLVGFRRGGDAGDTAGSGPLAALSSGARRLKSSLMSCSWGCLCCLCRCWSSLFSLSLFRLRDTVS